ncbi:hypothetical protein ACFVT9_28035 [Kitasatospora cineracea]|uniref:hypothetical protein n=1 Tax=Kitasatospora cineracea TaxID=88074 RepID=UPI0036D7C09F
MTVTNSFSGNSNFTGLLIQAGSVSGPVVNSGTDSRDATSEHRAANIEEALTAEGEPVTLARGEYQALAVLLDHLADTPEYQELAQTLADRLQGR